MKHGRDSRQVLEVFLLLPTRMTMKMTSTGHKHTQFTSVNECVMKANQEEKSSEREEQRVGFLVRML